MGAQTGDLECVKCRYIGHPSEFEKAAAKKELESRN